MECSRFSAPRGLRTEHTRCDHVLTVAVHCSMSPSPVPWLYRPSPAEPKHKHKHCLSVIPLRTAASGSCILPTCQRIPHTHHVTNVEVRATTGCRPLSHLVNDRRLRLFGHTACMQLTTRGPSPHCRCGDPEAASRFK